MRLRPLTEAECYTRCYGGRRDDVALVEVVPQLGERDEISGQRLRELLERQLAEHAAEPGLEAA